MKKLLLLLCFVTGLFAENSNLKWVDEQVAAIKPPRQGISSTQVEQVKSPFYFYKKSAPSAAKKSTDAAVKPGEKKPKVKRYGGIKLFAILNDSVLINGKWYRLNDKVSGYKVAKIGHSSVLLTQGKKQRKLYITAENKKIKIQTK